MIRVGTLCLIVRDHPLAGRTCTVIGDLRERDFIPRNNPRHHERREAYAIAIPDVRPRPPADGIGAFPHQIIPLTPPREPVDLPVAVGEPERLIR